MIMWLFGLSLQQRTGSVVVILIGEEATVKRLFKRGKKIELKPDNDRSGVFRLKEGSEEVQILGKVIGVFRKV